MAKKAKPSTDSNKRAKAIVDFVTGEDEDTKNEDRRNVAAVALGRLSGLKDGKARAASLTPEQRSEIAKKPAAKRWSKKSN